MTGKNRTVIEKGERYFVGEHNPGRDCSAHDPTEKAGQVIQESLQGYNELESYLQRALCAPNGALARP
jgi:hypothetical protein